jgi:hypothetical protein
MKRQTKTFLLNIATGVALAASALLMFTPAGAVAPQSGVQQVASATQIG